MKRTALYQAITALGLSLTGSVSFAAESAGALEEVVITAQRRTETLQDAAIAIDAKTGESLMKSGITNAYELNKVVPALTLTNGGGAFAALYIRGVGNRTTSAYIDPAVATSYDGVFMGRASGASSATFFDLERVEVLKGPQGTLYGRNATGGAINIIPNKPVIGETSGYISADIGNIGSQNAQGAINVPIGENTAMRLSASSNQRDGLNKDGTSDIDEHAFRLQWLTQINDRLSIRIGADYEDIGGVGYGSTYTGNYVATGLGEYTLVPSNLDIDEGMNTAAANAYRSSLLGAPGFGFLSAIQDDWYNDNQFKGINAEINYSTDYGTLTIIPAWREVKQDSKWGVPGFNSGWFQEEDEQTSLEVRFASESETRLNYIVGAYYIEETIEGNNTFNQEYVLPFQEFEQDSESWAVFSQFTFDLSDATRLVAGVRYTDDEKEMEGYINNYITFCGAPPPDLISPPDSFDAGCATPGNLPIFPTLDNETQADAWLIANGWAAAFIDVAPGVRVIPLSTGVGTILNIIDTTSDSYANTKTTYRLAYEWDVAEDSLLYISYETGYRAGGFQLANAPTYEPEFLDALTIGSKNQFFSGSLQVNAELFFWDYEDQQISYFTVYNGVLENLTDNVGAATSKGIDLDVQWAAGTNTLLSAKVQYLKAEYDDLHFESSPPRDNINCPSTVIGTVSDTDSTPLLDFDCSGNQAIYSPELTVIAGVEQTFPLDEMDLIVSLNSKWVDDQVSGFWNLQHEVIDSYTMTDLDITLESTSSGWSVSAYAHNLEDKRRLESTQASPMGMAMSIYGAPLTYGVRFSYTF